MHNAFAKGKVCVCVCVCVCDTHTFWCAQSLR